MEIHDFCLKINVFGRLCSCGDTKVNYIAIPVAVASVADSEGGTLWMRCEKVTR